LEKLTLDLFEIILVLFSGISFIVYGILFFTSVKMREEFERFGLSKFATLTGVLELMGGMGLIIGLKVHIILLLASGGLALLMLLGFGVRLKMKDGFLLSFPSVFFMIVNLYIFLTASKLG
jgi:uncharacterized membrane protein YphA (DoxX/SURF4 family)